MPGSIFNARHDPSLRNDHQLPLNFSSLFRSSERLSEQLLILPLPPPNHGRNSLPLSAETPFPPALRPGGLGTVPVPIARAATASSICAHQPFLPLFVLPSRSRAASCNVCGATCILTSASSNLFRVTSVCGPYIFRCSGPSHFL